MARVLAVVLSKYEVVVTKHGTVASSYQSRPVNYSQPYRGSFGFHFKGQQSKTTRPQSRLGDFCPNAFTLVKAAAKAPHSHCFNQVAGLANFLQPKYFLALRDAMK